MNIHEYQAKGVFAQFGVWVPRGNVAHTAEEAVEIARRLKGSVYVVKAQIHAGGRGKAGGVKVCKSLDEVFEAATKILGFTLVTHQTGPKGQLVRRVLVEEGLAIAKELYLSLVLDRENERIVLMGSTEGGMEIEQVAKNTPEKIIKESIDPIVGLQPFQIRNVVAGLALFGATAKLAATFLKGLYQMFIEKDASLVEINPLVITADGQLVALDAKMNFDDNALYRQQDIVAMHDPDEEDPLEVEASKADLSYIKLDGDIGNLVNGAGLAMATMDIIQHFGGSPANFLDVGGSADRAKVKAAFEIILKDKPKAILVNIFGGIMYCDVIADGVVAAAREVDLNVPLVVRLQGTNVEEGRKILKESGLTIISAQTMEEAARKVVAASKAGV
ncbi:MAG TPA: ADP-forming succinate--CoA ligase subunit beta [Myxococcota bacterium]|mgnify:CR=1 FL=1|nr:ADP-forming succinate--CoA ligase subunit beta [Myxococcota bacterium]HON24471.1 ADP-forming succinate--CoA ligase subunit beta [Myxococcota bacterium]HOS61857.1 ADP-forming succinate--CoA ligase subunit beta [Myxococcota bacterium]HPC91500.1 ADP-forming succinate--CoA ligase subunit beta [Myxococcota bacterium]HPL25241.1 ADP-forming succinate--CoA ligase subunit beta [Myxococcota bacterium]